MAEFVKIKHSKTDAVGSCPVGALPYWQEKGWKALDEDAAKEALSDLPEGQAEALADAAKQEDGTAAASAETPKKSGRRTSGS